LADEVRQVKIFMDHVVPLIEEKTKT